MILSLNGIIAGKGVIPSTLLTNLYSVYKAESNANDSFGTNNGTPLGGLTYTTGMSGDAFQFNGTNSYVSIPNNTSHLNFTSDFSISFWINYNTTAASLEVFFSNIKSGGTHGSGYVVYSNSSGIVFELKAQSVSNSFSVSFIPSINTWYNIVVTRKRSTESKIYINGALQSGSYVYSNPTVDQTYQTSQEYNIGAYLSAIPYLSNIKMDEINIWNKELTSTEVTELYNGGSGKFYPY